MPLNSLIKEYSLRTLAERTNISTSNLSRLANKEWGKLQKAHVAGFINILEREYGIDLSELKQEASSFYATHKAPTSNRPIDLVGASSVGGRGSKVVTNLVTLLTLALVVYASWYYFANNTRVDGVQSSQSNSTSGMFGDTLKSVKNIIGLEDKKEPKEKLNQESNASIQKSTNISEENNTLKELPQKELLQKELPQKELAQKELPESKEGAVEQNSSVNEELNTTTLAVGNTTASKESVVSATSEPKSTVKSQVDALLDEEELNNTLENNATAEKSIEQNSTVVDTNSTAIEAAAEDNSSAKVVQSAVIGSITVIPKSKRLWLGIYDLKSHKKLSKIITSNLELPVASKLAIVTGHSHLAIEGSGMAPINFAKTRKGRLYLLVSNNGVKEITKNEYKAATNEKAW